MTTTYEATMLSRMAEEARSVANDMREPGQRLYMLQIAARYDRNGLTQTKRRSNSPCPRHARYEATRAANA
jgi:hypothetical protein